MKVARQLSVLLSSACVALSTATAQALPAPLQTDLSDRNLQTLEKLVAIAQQHSAAIKAAKAELGISSWGDSVIFEISPAYSTGSFVEDREQFTGNDRSVSVSLILNPLQIVGALQQHPALRAQLREAIKQKRAEVVEAYIAYLQAKQTQVIAQHQLQQHLNKANPEALTVTNEVFIANSNERVALENLAAVVGQTPDQMLEILELKVYRQSSAISKEAE
jgi:outer membrane protein TolC